MASLEGEYSIVGRSVVLHQTDLVTGEIGEPVACGTIELSLDTNAADIGAEH